MVQFPGREEEARGEVIVFEIGMLSQYLLAAHVRGEEFEHVAHPNAQPTDAGSASAPVGLARDPLQQLIHSFIM